MYAFCDSQKSFSYFVIGFLNTTHDFHVLEANQISQYLIQFIIQELYLLVNST